jgi:hypothetical protein
MCKSLVRGRRPVLARNARQPFLRQFNYETDTTIVGEIVRSQCFLTHEHGATSEAGSNLDGEATYPPEFKQSGNSG